MCEEDERLMQEAIDQIRKLLNPKPEDDNFGYRDLRTSFEKVVGEIACMFYLDGDRNMERIIVFDPERVKLADVTRLQDSTPSVDWEDQVIFNSEGSFEFVELDEEQAREVDDWLDGQESLSRFGDAYDIEELITLFEKIAYSSESNSDNGTAYSAYITSAHTIFKEWVRLIRRYNKDEPGNLTFDPRERPWGRRG